MKTQDRKGCETNLGLTAETQIICCGVPRGGPVRSNLMGVCGRRTGEERKSPAGPRSASRRIPGCVPQGSGVHPASPQGASRKIPGCVPQDPRVRGSTHHFPLLGGLVHSGHHLVMEKQKQGLVRHFPPMSPGPSRLQFSAGLTAPVSPPWWPAPDPLSSGLTPLPRPRKAAVDRPRPSAGPPPLGPETL